MTYLLLKIIIWLKNYTNLGCWSLISSSLTEIKLRKSCCFSQFISSKPFNTVRFKALELKNLDDGKFIVNLHLYYSDIN